MNRKYVILLILGIVYSQLKGQSVELDTHFKLNYSCEVNNIITSLEPIVIQADGKIISGGQIRLKTKDESIQNNLFRLYPNGDIDKSFNIGKGLNSLVNFISLMPDNKILLCGYFSSFNGLPCRNIIQLNSNGTLDTSFNNSLYKDLAQVYSIAIQSEGKPIIYGSDSLLNPFVIRLNKDGSLDESFEKIIVDPFFESGKDLLITPQDDIFFLKVDSFHRKYIVKLNKNGKVDSSFKMDKQLRISFFRQFSLQGKDKLLIAGELTTFNDSLNKQLVRLNKDGKLDLAFKCPDELINNRNSGVFSNLVQSDDKIILCGLFRRFNGLDNTRLIRLHPNGEVDRTFELADGFEAEVKGVCNYFDSSIIITGNFKQFGIYNTCGIAKLNLKESGDDLDYVIYPNPSKDIFTIRANRTVTNIVVFDILGKEIIGIKPLTTKVNIDLTNQSNGIYLVKVFSATESKTQRILKH